MADLPVTINSASAGATGMQDLLTFVGAAKIPAPRIWARPLRFLNANYSREIAQRGQTVTVQVLPVIATQLITDGQSVQNDDTVATAVALTLNRERHTTFSFTELYNAMKSGPEMFNAFLTSRIFGLLNDVEADVFSVTNSFTTNAGSYNTNLTEDAILAGFTNIAANKPPKGTTLIGLLREGASSWSAFSKLTGASQATYRGFPQMSPMTMPLEAYGGDTSGNEALIWHGINWFLSQAPIRSGTSTSNTIFHPLAIAFINRQYAPPLAAGGVDYANFEIDGVQFQMTISWNKDNLSSQVTIRALYGFGIVKDAWGTELRS